MENFDQIFTLLAEHEGIALNTDILETGLINIIALIAILIYTGRDFLGSLLEERRTTILKGVQDAENRLTEATKRLSEAEKQLSQVRLVISKIESEAATTKRALLASDSSQAKKDLRIRFNRALETFKLKERQIFVEIKQQIISLVLHQTVNRAKKTFASKRRANKLIVETIKRFEGDFL